LESKKPPYISAAPPAPSQVIAIRTNGTTWLDRMIQVVILCLFPLGVILVIVVSGPKPPSDVVPRLIGILAVLVALDLMAESVTSVRRVEIGPEGVRFSFLFHHEVRIWTELEPSRTSPEHGGWYIVSRSRNGRSVSRRGYRLTIEQARALLTYPACPKWNLPSSVASS
jgi:hypothetical protein